MERVTTNLSPARIRTEVIKGKEYLVAGCTMLRTGTFAGSRGPVRYTLDALRKSAPHWENAAVTVGHPRDEWGDHVSANSDDVLRRVGVGRVFDVGMKGGSTLRAEVWLDTAVANRIDPRIVRTIRNGRAIECSTGLFILRGERGADGVLVAHELRPDHLALLPDEVGACSIRDGCGVAVNRHGPAVANCGGSTCGTCASKAVPIETMGFVVLHADDDDPLDQLDAELMRPPVIDWGDRT